MSDTEIKILDYKTLIQLNENLDYTADSLLRVIDAVNQYFDFVLDQIRCQVDEIETSMNEAKERLDEAEEDLSSCEASQEYDEEDRCWRPSCDCEKAAVYAARREYEEWQEKYNKAKDILSDVEREIEKYHQRPGIIIPGGGESTLEYLAKEHTDASTKKLDEIIQVVEEYLASRASLAGGNKSVSDVHEEALEALEEEKKSTNSEKAEKFRAAADEVRERMVHDMPTNAPSNEVVICSGCHRPIPLCICQRVRER